MSDMEDRVREAREERDRLIADCEGRIADTHRRFAVMLETEKEQVELDADGKTRAVHQVEKIAAAAGFTRPYLYDYIRKHLRPKKKDTTSS